MMYHSSLMELPRCEVEKRRSRPSIAPHHSSGGNSHTKYRNNGTYSSLCAKKPEAMVDMEHHEESLVNKTTPNAGER